MLEDLQREVAKCQFWAAQASGWWPTVGHTDDGGERIGAVAILRGNPDGVFIL